MNRFEFIGNLVRDAEMQTVGDNMQVCKFEVAVNRPYKKGKDQEVDYYKVNAWRKQGEYCAQNLKKGNKVYVAGQLEIRNYEGRDGAKRMSVEVQANEVEKLTGFEAKTNEPKMIPIATQDGFPF